MEAGQAGIEDKRVVLLLAGLGVFVVFLVLMIRGDRKSRKKDGTERNG